MSRMLAVRLGKCDYLSVYEVTYARNFDEAKILIEQAEKNGRPFDDLDLPVNNERKFWEFIKWMKQRCRCYPFSIYGYKNARHFIKIRDKTTKMGMHFNS